MAQPQRKLKVAPEVTITRFVLRPLGEGSGKWGVYKQTLTGVPVEEAIVEDVAYHLAQLEMEQAHEDETQRRREEENW